MLSDIPIVFIANLFLFHSLYYDLNIIRYFQVLTQTLRSYWFPKDHLCPIQYSLRRFACRRVVLSFSNDLEWPMWLIT